MSEESPERRFRTLFISDIHLGARGSQAEQLLDFLRDHDADTIYLVGDIVDGWALQSSWYWPQSHNDFVQKILRKARKGASVIYVPGNHDEVMRNFYGTHFGGIDVMENTIHDSADGRRFLIIHGDLFDSWCKTPAGSRSLATMPMISPSGSIALSMCFGAGSACPIGRCHDGPS